METSDFAVELRKIEKLVRHVSSERYSGSFADVL